MPNDQRHPSSTHDDAVAAKAAALGLLLMLSAYGMARAMETPQYWWLGWFALLPLFLSIRILTPAGALLAGGAWGLSLFVFSVLAAQTQVGATLSSLVLLTAVPAVYAYAGARLTRQIGFSPFLLALGWVGVEFALGPLGLRYGLLAATQGDGLVLRAIGSFAGYVVVSFLVAYVNAALVSVLAGVPDGAARRLMARGLPRDASRIACGDAWVGVLHLLRPARPRAPPVAVPSSARHRVS